MPESLVLQTVNDTHASRLTWRFSEMPGNIQSGFWNWGVFDIAIAERRSVFVRLQSKFLWRDPALNLLNINDRASGIELISLFASAASLHVHVCFAWMIELAAAMSASYSKNNESINIRSKFKSTKALSDNWHKFAAERKSCSLSWVNMFFHGTKRTLWLNWLFPKLPS